MTKSLTSFQSYSSVLAQPWLASAPWDGIFILSPALITSFVALAFRSQLAENSSIPVWAWVVLVLLVDVAHVYATLFRTYLDPEAFQKNRTLLLTVPISCLIVSCLLYSVNWMLFWTALAYLAVFHFIRQQYGFVALYSRQDPAVFQRFVWLDGLTIYMATIYPLLFWHTHLPRNFNWFIEGDFVNSMPLIVAHIGLILYMVTASLYIAKELILLKTTGFFNIPRNVLTLGTALSWWVGIVALNSDLAFTMTNVVSHGVPYMALIWLYRRRFDSDDKSLTPIFDGKAWLIRARNIAVTYAPVFVLSMTLLAYLEEGLWDGFIWREHLHLFAPFSHLPVISDPTLLAILVPLLSLPQSTHYVLDGFIWRVKDRQSVWSA